MHLNCTIIWSNLWCNDYDNNSIYCTLKLVFLLDMSHIQNSFQEHQFLEPSIHVCILKMLQHADMTKFKHKNFQTKIIFLISQETSVKGYMIVSIVIS